MRICSSITSWPWRLLIALAALTAATAQAADRNWKAATTGAWDNTASWAESAVPIDGDDVYITNAGAYAFLNVPSSNLNSITIGRTLIFTNWNNWLTASNVTIQNGGQIALPAAFTTNDGLSNRVYIACTNLTLEAGGQINADGKGFAGGLQNQPSRPAFGPGRGIYGAGTGSGAGYGGQGGISSYQTAVGVVYGPSNAPLDPGSGGGADNNGAGGAGGGAVWIEASGEVTVNGTISANGAGGRSGGSGGAVYIAGATFGGTSGAIRAKGGTAGTGFGGGGGGRIAVIYTTAGDRGVQFDASPGAGYAFDLTDPAAAQMGTLYLSSTNALTDVWKNQIKGAFLFAPDFTAWNEPVTISNAVVGVPDGFIFDASSVQLGTNCGLFMGPNQPLNLAAFSMPAGSLFKMGTNALFSCAGAMALSTNARFRVDSNSSFNCGGDLILGTNTTLTIMADSSMTCTGTVAILTNALLRTGTNVTVSCRSNVVLNTGQLLLDVGPTFSCGGDLVLTNGSATTGANFTVYSGVTNGTTVYGRLVSVTGNVFISAASWVYPYSHNTNGGSVKFAANKLSIIGANGGFNADSRGFAGGLQNQPALRGYGPGGGGYGAGAGAGAGHGGKGGNSGWSSSPGNPCGSTNAPIIPGSGGGGDNNGAGGYGGGTVWIDTPGKITVEGVISANGSSSRGAGSGGAVYLVCSSFSGITGIIRAEGGIASGSFGGGGGGRVAVWIGLSESEKTQALAGDLSSLIVAPTNRGFIGTLSATNGTGYTNFPPGGAEQGTIIFLTSPTMAVQSQPATAITTNSATLTGRITDTNSAGNAAVYFCWGYSDAGTDDLNAWDHYNLQASDWEKDAIFSTNITDLLSGSGYVYRCFASNAVGTAWSETQSFTTVYLPAVTNPGSIDAETVNTLQGAIFDTGGDIPYCWFYYWAEGSASTSIVAMGQQSTGTVFNTSLYLLPRSTLYHYNILASNMAGGVWSTTSNFTTSAYEPLLRTWIGSSDSNWFTPTNWSPAGAPLPCDSVLISSASSTANILLTNSTPPLGDFSITNRTLTFTNWGTVLTASNLTVQNGGQFTLPAAFTTNDGLSNRVYIICTNLTLEAGGQINVDGKGFAGGLQGQSTRPAFGPGHGIYGAGTGSGAGHGGAGGISSYQTAVGGTYGTIDAPSISGSGGGADNNGAGGAGGGAVRIEAGGEVAVNGTISANGAGGRSGGSGGAIHITCATFSGTSGVIQAKGGVAGSTYGGGGGGRIAVNYTTAGTCGVRFDASPGTGYVTDLTSLNAAQMGTLFLSHTNVLIDIWKNQVRGAWLYSPDFTAWNSPVAVSNALVGVPDEVAFAATDLQVAGTNNGIFLGVNAQATSGALTLMSNSLIRFGISNGYVCSSLELQGNAKFRMLDGSVFTNHGMLAVGSNAAFSLHENGNMKCGGAITVTGYSASLLWLGAYAVLTGSGDLLVDRGQVFMNTGAVINCGGALNLTNGATLYAYSGPTNGADAYGGYVGVTGTVSLAPSCWIYPNADPTNGGAMKFNLGALAVATNAGFNADAKGYLWNGGAFGPGQGLGDPYAGSGAGHGGKGGAIAATNGGAVYGSSYVPITAGSTGGGKTGYGIGGSGGGVVWIETVGSIGLDGTLSANGANGSTAGYNAGGGGGSGGSVFLACQSFQGGTSAVIQANGKDGAATPTPGGAGGGGRIAVWIGLSDAEKTQALLGNVSHLTLADNNRYYLGTLSVTNGTGYTNLPPGGAATGTIFFVTSHPRGIVFSFR